MILLDDEHINALLDELPLKRYLSSVRHDHRTGDMYLDIFDGITNDFVWPLPDKPDRNVDGCDNVNEIIGRMNDDYNIYVNELCMYLKYYPYYDVTSEA